MDLKKISISIATILFTLSLWGQDLPVESIYLLSENLVNPALSGKNTCQEFSLTHKQQWAGIENAPATQTASFFGRINKHNGAGITVFNDKNGFTKNLGIRLSYAFHIPLSQNIKSPLRTQLSFGVLYSIQNLAINSQDFNNQLPDPAIDQGEYSSYYSNAGAGIFFMHKGFYTGFSAMNLLPVSVDFYLSEPEMPKNFFYQIGYLLNSKGKVQLRPSILYKMNTIKEKQIDLNMQLRYVSKNTPDGSENPLKSQSNTKLWSIWTESSYQSNLGVSPGAGIGFIQVVGMSFDEYTIAYAYTAPLGEISNYFSATHQVMVGVTFCSSTQKVHKMETVLNPAKPSKKLKSLGLNTNVAKSGSNNIHTTGILKRKNKDTRKKKYKTRPNQLNLKKIKGVPCHSYDKK